VSGAEETLRPRSRHLTERNRPVEETPIPEKTGEGAVSETPDATRAGPDPHRRSGGGKKPTIPPARAPPAMTITPDVDAKLPTHARADHHAHATTTSNPYFPTHTPLSSDLHARAHAHHAQAHPPLPHGGRHPHPNRDPTVTHTGRSTTQPTPTLPHRAPRHLHPTPSSQPPPWLTALPSAGMTTRRWLDLLIMPPDGVLSVIVPRQRFADEPTGRRTASGFSLSRARRPAHAALSGAQRLNYERRCQPALANTQASFPLRELDCLPNENAAGDLYAWL
jgi:hypothetical protein